MMGSIYLEPVAAAASPAKLIIKKWQVIALSFLTFAG